MRPPSIPESLARNVTETWGSAGGQWLAELPRHVAAAARQWDLELGEPFDLSYHWVTAVGQADGSPAVLKLGLPREEHLAHEAAALAAFAGRGAVRLLAFDPARGALLLERALPGDLARTLVPQRDAEATQAVIEVLRQLHVDTPPGCSLPRLEAERVSFVQHLRRFPGDEPLPRHLVGLALRLFDELCETAPRRVVLHGDLHHDNLIRATRAPWLAIDPHGALGDPGYDVGALLYNPDPARRDDCLLRLVPARVEQLTAGLEMPVERVVAWGFVMAVLSEVWTCEGAGGHGVPGGRPLDVALHLLPRLG